jgi:hypothetical protein
MILKINKYSIEGASPEREGKMTEVFHFHLTCVHQVPGSPLIRQLKET